MLGNATVTAFVATANPVRAKAFYRDTLGLRLVSDDQFAIAFDCNGVQLRIQKVEKVSHTRLQPSAGTYQVFGTPYRDSRSAALPLSGIRSWSRTTWGSGGHRAPPK